jgi:fatty acid synthase subunit alpha
MLSLLHEPSSRLATQEVSEQWLSSVLQAYAQEERLPLPKSGGGGGAVGSAGPAVPSADVLAMVLRHDSVWRDQLESVARYLKFDLRGGQKLVERERVGREALERTVDMWKVFTSSFRVFVERSFSRNRPKGGARHVL